MELIDRLRNKLNLSEYQASDEEILKATKGSFLRAMIELKMAWEKLLNARDPKIH